MTEHPDVLILGGGVIGLTTAFYLKQRRVQVEVVDRGDFGRESSWAGAGIISAAPRRGRARTPLARLQALSAELFPELSETLRDPTNVDNGYVANGGFVLVEGDPAPFLHEWQADDILFEELAGQKLEQFEPALKPGGRRAYFLPDTAQVRNPRHLKALLAWCGLHGVRLRPSCPVYGFERQGQRITAVRTAVGPLHAGKYLLATGAWTDGLLEPLGWRPGIRPVRGQIALLNSGAPVITRVVELGRRYLVPRPDGRVLAGSTEEDAGFDKRTTAEAIRGLLDLACTLVPALGRAPVERCWAGLRPGSPDEMPFLGPVPGLDNLFVAAGHFRAGIQLSPGTGLAMAELLCGQAPGVPLEAFRLDRPMV
jgi:glycine oxidase